jgi:putative cell wall-binding protein
MGSRRRTRRGAARRTAGAGIASLALLVSVASAELSATTDAGAQQAGAAAPAQGKVAAAAHASGQPAVPDLQEVWSKRLADGPHGEVALGSPSLATLTGGPAVVFGDRSGRVYALNLATGDPVPGWPKLLGTPVTSTPSVLKRPGTAFDTVIVGSGNAAEPCAGGYEWLLPTGTHDLVRGPNPPTDRACGASGVFAGIAIGTIGGVTGAVAGTLGQETYAFDATTGAVLPGFPWFQADTNFTTPAIADVEGSGANQIILGGAQTAGIAYGRKYTQGGHIQILGATGSLLCADTTDESINSSPAVGKFLAGTAIGIVAGTGPTFPAASQRDQVIAVNAHCQQVWATTLAGTTGYESPALADVLGNGQLQVIVTTYAGGVYALAGVNGARLWHTQLAHHIYGSPVTVELGTGRQDVVVGTINGFDVLTGRNGDVLVATVTPTIGFQNAPLITKDANGTIGITVVGYQPDDSWVTHYEIATSNGNNVDAPGTWPEFHHDPQLTGNANAPIVSTFAAYTRIGGATPEATAAAELEHQFQVTGGNCPGTTATRPVLLATAKTYPDALASAPLARSLATGTLLTTPTALSAPTAAALAREGITHVTVLGGPLAVSTAVVTKLEATPATTCGGRGTTGSDITVTRIAGATAYETAAQIAAAAAVSGVGSLDLAAAYAGTNATGGGGRFNLTAGTASRAPVSGGALVTAVLATGSGFQDAESASTLAYAEKLPVLLTAPTSLSAPAAAAISSLHIAQVVVMGGQLAVSDAVVAAVKGMGVSVLRVAGEDATGTAVELARLETSPVGAGVGWHGTGDLTVAQGGYFSDGLAGAVVAADGPAVTDPEPLVLTESPTTVGTPLSAFLHQAGTTGLDGTAVTHLTILGGPLALTPPTVQAMGRDL